MDASSYRALVKKYFLWCGILCLLVATVFIAVVYTLDPLQFFHRATKADGPLSSDMRAQAAGILNSFDIDSIILGTSMLENTSAAEASAKLGGKFFNISISAGDHAERSIILKRALRKNIKNVIYSLDNSYITCSQREDRIPAYLYDTNPFNDLRYYITAANIKKLFQNDSGLTLTDHDHPMAWFHVPDHRDRFGGIGQWVAHKNNPQIKDLVNQRLPQLAATFPTDTRRTIHSPEKEKLAKQYIEKYFLDIIQDHDGTNFYLIIPPYSRLLYAIQRRKNPEDFFLHQEIIRYLVERTKEKKNIHIYGFEDQDFLDDIANYKDATHYHQKFNTLFLDAIAGDKHELTPENVEEYLKRCEQKAWDYDIPALNDEVQRLMKKAAKKENG